jgi:Protein of unknown function (DUF3592)
VVSVARVAFPVSRRASWVGYLTVGSIFLWIWQPDLFSGYVWGIILAAGGVVFLLSFVRPALRLRRQLKNGAPSQGTVVGAVQQTSDAKTYYHPRVQFTTADGRTVVFTSAFGSEFTPDVGDPVPVRYRPDSPEHAEVDSTIMWILPAAVGSLFGVGCFCSQWSRSWGHRQPVMAEGV